MSSSKTLLGIIAGAAIGAVAGILLAPDKGSETRKKLSSKTGDLADNVKNSFGEFIDQVKNSYSKAEGHMEDLEHKTKAKMSEIKDEFRTSVDNSF